MLWWRNFDFGVLSICPLYSLEAVYLYERVVLKLEYFNEKQSQAASHITVMLTKLQTPGPRLNIKTVLSRYGDSYVKDKTAVRTSYL